MRAGQMGTWQNIKKNSKRPKDKKKFVKRTKKKMTRSLDRVRNNNIKDRSIQSNHDFPDYIAATARQF